MTIFNVDKIAVDKIALTKIKTQQTQICCVSFPNQISPLGRQFNFIRIVEARSGFNSVNKKYRLPVEYHLRTDTCTQFLPSSFQTTENQSIVQTHMCMNFARFFIFAQHKLQQCTSTGSDRIRWEGGARRSKNRQIQSAHSTQIRKHSYHLG